MGRLFNRKKVTYLCIITMVIFCITYYLSDDEDEILWSFLPKSDIKSPEIVLFIGIVSAPVRLDRRIAIRETWSTNCTINNRCVLKFITDLPNKTGDVLVEEDRSSNDLVFCPTPPGVNYARRYLWWIDWVINHYDAKYILRIDDDYFICINKLILELSFYRPRTKFLWGWLHCSNGKLQVTSNLENSDCHFINGSIILLTRNTEMATLRMLKCLLTNFVNSS